MLTLTALLGFHTTQMTDLDRLQTLFHRCGPSRVRHSPCGQLLWGHRVNDDQHHRRKHAVQPDLPNNDVQCERECRHWRGIRCVPIASTHDHRGLSLLAKIAQNTYGWRATARLSGSREVLCSVLIVQHSWWSVNHLTHSLLSLLAL